uniref:Lon N-terminal domain-containing protein n=1 Tax=Kalanchoe fedtschenkoi TaxID=63787 RepID=A0A7N0TFC2_KALFE
MLKLISAPSLRARAHAAAASPSLRSDSTSPVLRMLGSVLKRRRCPCVDGGLSRVFFCSDASDGSGTAAEAEVKVVEADAGETESNSAAIVPTNPKPEDFLTVLALPLPHRPLFPGFYMPIYVKDPKLLAALVESRKRQAPYAGAFLVKDEPGDTSTTETEKNIYEFKGKDLLNRLHDVGTLAQISSINGDQVVLIGHRRLRITEMVCEDPLKVKVDHLKDMPYDKDDDVIKATSFEVISTLRDVLKTSSLWRDHVQTYTQVRFPNKNNFFCVMKLLFMSIL